jgi:hypothetical protein
MPAVNPLQDLLELVRSAAREGAVEALQTQAAAATKPMNPLIDKRTLAQALGVSMASIDRLCRDERIPFVLVGEVRRFDLEAVRQALPARAPGPVQSEPARPPPAAAPISPSLEIPIAGVKLLSRGGRSR